MDRQAAMDPVTQFHSDCSSQIAEQGADTDLQALSRIWLREISQYRYQYHFTWLGRPIIQLPQDVLAIQEIIWRTKPDLVIETGVAHGGSLILSASMLELLGGGRKVIGIDVDIRAHNRRLISEHPLAHRIDLIQGSSTDEIVLAQVRAAAAGRRQVMVILDSCHTHEHVLRELELYSHYVSLDCYLIVFDTLIEQMPEKFFEDRPWGRGNNPLTAVRTFVDRSTDFEIDTTITNKLLLTAAPDGYLRRVKSSAPFTLQSTASAEE